MRSWSSLYRSILLLSAALMFSCSSDSSTVDTGAQDGDVCTGRGCTDVGGGGGGGGGGSDEDVVSGERACSETGECPGNLVCDADRDLCVGACAFDSDCLPTERCGDAGVCVQRPRCTSTGDCSGGLTCNTCLQVCTAPPAGSECRVGQNNCGFDEYCDPCTLACLPQRSLCDPCTEDLECGEARDLCLDFSEGGRFCGRSCGACPVGYRCEPSVAQCVPLSGSCERVRQCATSADCPAGRTCTPAFICAAGCQGDEACPGDQVCVTGSCIEPCDSAADCPAPAECVDRRCRVPGGCLTSVDCEEAETFCDVATNRCVPGCEVDEDCLDGFRECVSGRCQLKGCRGAFSCAFGQFCTIETGQCVDAGPEYCATCNEREVDSCGARSVCGALEEGGPGYCFVACSDDIDNLCPQGYGCQEVDVDGDMRRVCFRRCDREPI
jgi:hypothetical protein